MTHPATITAGMRTVWYLTPTLTLAGLRTATTTPSDVLQSIVTLLYRIATNLQAAGQTEGLVLLDEAVAAQLGLRGAAGSALLYAREAGWTHSEAGADTSMVSFWADGRPTVHIGRLALLQARGTRAWPWSQTGWDADMVAALQAWHCLTGRAWSATPAVMGLELMHTHLQAWRYRDRADQQRQAPAILRDENTPDGAGEAPWTPAMWRGVNGYQAGRYWHAYDRRRAGLTAAAAAKLAAAPLTRGWHRFDRDRAGWWQISVPVWNDKRMPHPCGPGATSWSRFWVTTSTMDLVADLAREGVIDMPEVIDALTAPGRTLLRDWSDALEHAYQYPPDDDLYHPAANRPVVQQAVKEAANAGIGMLGKADGQSSIWRPDWMHAIAGLKRANGWRKAWQVGKATTAAGDPRWPVAVDDDAWYYASDLSDPYQAAPPGLELGLDKRGSYRHHITLDTTQHNTMNDTQNNTMNSTMNSTVDDDSPTVG